jgi:hypothetical protein
MDIRHPPASATAGPAGTVVGGAVVGEGARVVAGAGDEDEDEAPTAAVVDPSSLSEHPLASASVTPATASPRRTNERITRR